MTQGAPDIQSNEPLSDNVQRVLALFDYFGRQPKYQVGGVGDTITALTVAALTIMGEKADLVSCFWRDTDGEDAHNPPRAVMVDGQVIGPAGAIGWEAIINQFQEQQSWPRRFASSTREIVEPNIFTGHEGSVFRTEVDAALDWLRAQERAVALEEGSPGAGRVARKARL